VPVGKKIKCPGCGDSLQVPDTEEPQTVEIEAEAPPRRRRAAPRDDEEDFDDEREERPAPRKRRKKKKKAASSLPLILGLSIGGGVLLLSGVVALAVFRPWESKTGTTVAATDTTRPRTQDPGKGMRQEQPGDQRPEGKGFGGGGDGQFASAGKRVYDAQVCSGCHALGGGGGGYTGGGRGPSLAGVGSKHNAQWLTEHVRNPKSHRANSRMPAYEEKMSPDELRSIGEYLASLR
jgi:mono/diheme cytochrome c family protein